MLRQECILEFFVNFQASKVKSNADAESLQDDTGNPSRTDLPPEPKTPDAMDHMPEQMKTEYRRLKEQLAMREKTRQPLANVNQEKGTKLYVVVNEIKVIFICPLFQLH